MTASITSSIQPSITPSIGDAVALDPVMDYSSPDFIFAHTMDRKTGSTLEDETSNNRDFTITGATAFTGAVGDGLTGVSGQYAESTDAGLVTAIKTTGASFALWVQNTDAVGVETSFSISNATDTAKRGSIHVRHLGSGVHVVEVQIAPTGVVTRYQSVTTFAENTLIHATVQKEGATPVIFINGVKENMVLVAGSAFWFDDLPADANIVRYCGVLIGGADTNTGWADEMRALDRNFTQEEATLMAAET